MLLVKGLTVQILLFLFIGSVFSGMFFNKSTITQYLPPPVATTAVQNYNVPVNNKKSLASSPLTTTNNTPSYSDTGWLHLSTAQQKDAEQATYVYANGYVENEGKVYYDSQPGSISPSGSMDFQSGTDISLIDGADPATFSIFEGVGFSPYAFGKDKNHVYYEQSVITGADPVSFTPLADSNVNGAYESGYVVDQEHVFCQQGQNSSFRPIPGADPTTFLVVIYQYTDSFSYDDRTHYAKDKNHVYIGCAISSTIISPNNFTALYSKHVDNNENSLGAFSGYFKNNYAVYFVDPNGTNSPAPNLIPGADPTSFVVPENENSHFYAKDKNHTYLDGIVQ